jgi:hypothetical protein
VIDESEVDEKLRALADATAPLRPNVGFSLRVMDAVSREPTGLMSQIVTASRRLIPLALLVAATAGLWAVQMDDTVDDVLTASYGEVEVEW